jgi:hypothetical protein
VVAAVKELIESAIKFNALLDLAAPKLFYLYDDIEEAVMEISAELDHPDEITDEHVQQIIDRVTAIHEATMQKRVETFDALVAAYDEATMQKRVETFDALVAAYDARLGSQQ